MHTDNGYDCWLRYKKIEDQRKELVDFHTYAVRRGSKVSDKVRT